MVIDGKTLRVLARSDWKTLRIKTKMSPDHPGNLPRVNSPEGREFLELIAAKVKRGDLSEKEARAMVARLL